MKIQTFTIVAGTAACNALCPYCISKMTGKELGMNEQEINWRNFDKACRLAQVNNVPTVLFTGKGEPTLYPKQISSFLKHMERFEFPLIELQTNALVFGKQDKKYKKYLKEWHNLGLNTISISAVHYKDEKNKEIFTPNSDYINLKKVIKNLHNLGYSIRLSCIMIKGYVDNVKEVKGLAGFCRENHVEQLTIRGVTIPDCPQDKQTYNWTKLHQVDPKNSEEICQFISKNAQKIMTLEQGAVVYDLDGQNICISDCLTIKPDTENLRQLIFFPDGHLRYDWQYKAAVLL